MSGAWLVLELVAIGVAAWCALGLLVSITFGRTAKHRDRVPYSPGSVTNRPEWNGRGRP